MDVLRDSTKWAIAQGVRLNGIAVHKFPGRRLGIIAEKDFEAGETLLTVPISALRTVRNVPDSVVNTIGTSTVHGLLAAELAMDTSSLHGPWRATLPSLEDFKESMPLMWPETLRTLLPPASWSLLEKQKRKLALDWTVVSAAFPTLSYDLYLHNWLIVSTRTFYYVSAETDTRKPFNRDDCLALIPFADYFNHADVGCEVTFSPSGYQICADRQIEKGEEILISYGNHSNDFLLAEYAFILTENKWDEISLDEFVLPLFSEEQKQKLTEANFSGGFVLDKEMVCYRTQVALRLLCMPLETWHCLLAKGFESGDKYQTAVNEFLLKALRAHLDIVHERLQQISVLGPGLSSQRETSRTRWEQIRRLVASALSRIEE